MKKVIGIILFLLIINSCAQDPYPLTPIENPTAYSGTWSPKWILYEDILNTLGGDILFYPSDPGKTIMYMENMKDGTAYSGDNYFRLFWNGDPVYWEADPPDNPTDCYEYSFVGISFIVATKPDYYDIFEPLDLSDGKYTKITLYARGVLSEHYKVKFEGPNGAIQDQVTLTSEWQKFEVDLYDMNNILDFFKVTIYYPPAELDPPYPKGSGGHVDFDLVTYER